MFKLADIFSSSLLWTGFIILCSRFVWYTKAIWQAEGYNQVWCFIFGITPKQANRLDPQIRLLLEVTYEAIVDAGGQQVLHSYC